MDHVGRTEALPATLAYLAGAVGLAGPPGEAPRRNRNTKIHPLAASGLSRDEEAAVLRATRLDGRLVAAFPAAAPRRLRRRVRR